jgi:hypothetical protein
MTYATPPLARNDRTGFTSVLQPPPVEEKERNLPPPDQASGGSTSGFTEYGPITAPLVSYIKDNNKVIPSWKNLSFKEKFYTVVFFAHLRGYLHFSLDLSNEFQDDIRYSPTRADDIRRRMRSHFIRKLGRVLPIAFVVEENYKKEIHIHGVVDMEGLSRDKLGEILLDTALGPKRHVVPELRAFARKTLHTGLIYNVLGWADYCLKDVGEDDKGLIYTSDNIRALARNDYEALRKNYKAS